jgi:hypothetical protein
VSFAKNPSAHNSLISTRTLKELGILDRTLIIVVSDRGASARWNYRLASVRTIV